MSRERNLSIAGMPSVPKEGWVAVQCKAFTRWMNTHLIKRYIHMSLLSFFIDLHLHHRCCCCCCCWHVGWRGCSGYKVEDIKTDLRSGINIINLLESLTDKSLGKYNKIIKMEIHALENMVNQQQPSFYHFQTYSYPYPYFDDIEHSIKLYDKRSKDEIG
jgi:hypothetical protein